jgi:hypothetical protein
MNYLNRQFEEQEAIYSDLIKGDMRNEGKYKKPEILAQSTKQTVLCRPVSKPSGRPCNPPKPSGR